MDIIQSINKGAVIDSKIIKCKNCKVPIKSSGHDNSQGTLVDESSPTPSFHYSHLLL